MLSRAEPRTILQRPWRIAALVGVVANITYNFASARIGEASMTVAEVSDKYQTLFTPAGYAFAIWGIIYGANLLYSVLALLPSQLEVHFHDRVAPWLLLTNALSSLWVSLFMDQQLGPSTLIIFATLVCSVVMYLLASDYLLVEHLSHFWRVPFGLWLGWLSVATIANLNLALSAAGWSGFPLPAALWTSLLLIGAGAIATAVGVLFLDPVVPLVIAWAALGISVEHWDESTLVGVVAALVALKSLMLGIRFSLFGSLKLPRAEREGIERDLRFVPTRRHTLA
jgi:hypothetical protein